MTYSLFALTSDPANRVMKFALSQEVQDTLTPYIQAQEQNFRNFSETEIIFDGKYKPDHGEVLVIENYDDIDGLWQAISNPLGIDEIEPTPEAFNSIKALFTGYLDQNGNSVILIQSFEKRKIISTNGLSIFHSANVYKKIEGIGITIDTKIAAILQDGNLRFFSFHMLRQIFDLSQYYLEATDSDIREFFSLPMIQASNINEIISISDTWIRRKFALIQQSQILEIVPMNDIKAVALEFNIPLSTTIENGNELICLPGNKAELKTILRFLDEDYYKSPLSNTRCVTNSKRIV